MTPERPPRVGLSTYRERVAWSVWDQPVDLLPADYADAVGAAGAVALLLPPNRPGSASAAAVLDGVDGLVLTGGADVHPQRYGAPADPHFGGARADRDAWESDLARAALARDLPVFAICRGMQLLNVTLGGDLVQHLPDAVGHEGHRPVVGEHGRHDVRTAPGSRVAGLIGPRAAVATYHHQAVDRLGAALTPTAWADDGTVEAVEHDSAGWVLGVQWHPEVHDGAALFADFVAACRASADTRTGASAGPGAAP